MNASRLFARDDKIRKQLGWSKLSFIAPKLPKPRSKSEKAVTEILEARQIKNVSHMHLYRVFELMEAAYRLGIKKCKKTKLNKR